MNELNLFDSIARVDEELIDRANRTKGKQKKATPRFVPVVAELVCFALLFGGVVLFPLLKKDPGETVPIDNGQAASIPPYLEEQIDNRFYDIFSTDQITADISNAFNWEQDDNGKPRTLTGAFVTATLEETLPDVYSFYSSYSVRFNTYLMKNEYRLLRMKTVRVLAGKDMVDDFYLLVPVEDMTDFSIYDRFVISHMLQYGYEYSVLYNKTQEKPEALNLVLFGLHANWSMMAFDENGDFDPRLWESNEHWNYNYHVISTPPATLAQAESNYGRISPDYRNAVLLKDVTGDAADVLAWSQSFENGLFVPDCSVYFTRSYISPCVQYHATRYVNNFATNEAVYVWGKGYWDFISIDSCFVTKAHFTEEDLADLPDLASAVETVTALLESGQLSPPHIDWRIEIDSSTYQIFSWYAKTPYGVLGIVRVDWKCIERNGNSYKTHEDDAYFIIEPGSDRVQNIGRDSLLFRLEDYERTYIFSGQYNNEGKVRKYYVYE